MDAVRPCEVRQRPLRSSAAIEVHALEGREEKTVGQLPGLGTQKIQKFQVPVRALLHRTAVYDATSSVLSALRPVLYYWNASCSLRLCPPPPSLVNSTFSQGRRGERRRRHHQAAENAPGERGSARPRHAGAKEEGLRRALRHVHHQARAQDSREERLRQCAIS